MRREGLSLIPIAVRLPWAQKCLKSLKSFFSGMYQRCRGQHILLGPERGEKPASPEAHQACTSHHSILRTPPVGCVTVSTSQCKDINAQMCLTWEKTLDKGN